MICTAHKILLGLSNREERDGLGMYHVWGTGEACTGLWTENRRERDHVEYIVVDGRINIWT